MSVICFGGFCIPCSVIWPVILLALREVYNFFFGGKKASGSKVTCKDGVCTVEDSTKSTASASGEPAVTPSTKSLADYDGKKELTDESHWQALMEGTDRPVIVRFSASWCVPCRSVEPLFEELACTFSEKAEFVTVDIDSFDEIAASHRVFSIPAILCFHKGVAMDSRVAGKDEEKIRSFVSESVNAFQSN